MSERFKAGDLVQLKSGGPVMTVSGVENLGYYCDWFAGAKDNSRFFSEATLKAAELES